VEHTLLQGRRTAQDSGRKSGVARGWERKISLFFNIGDFLYPCPRFEGWNRCNQRWFGRIPKDILEKQPALHLSLTNNGLEHSFIYKQWMKCQKMRVKCKELINEATKLIMQEAFAIGVDYGSRGEYKADDIESIADLSNDATKYLKIVAEPAL